MRSQVPRVMPDAMDGREAGVSHLQEQPASPLITIFMLSTATPHYSPLLEGYPSIPK